MRDTHAMMRISCARIRPVRRACVTPTTAMSWSRATADAPAAPAAPAAAQTPTAAVAAFAAAPPRATAQSSSTPYGTLRAGNAPLTAPASSRLRAAPRRERASASDGFPRVSDLRAALPVGAKSKRAKMHRMSMGARAGGMSSSSSSISVSDDTDVGAEREMIERLIANRIDENLSVFVVAGWGAKYAVVRVFDMKSLKKYQAEQAYVKLLAYAPGHVSSFIRRVDMTPTEMQLEKRNDQMYYLLDRLHVARVHRKEAPKNNKESLERVKGAMRDVFKYQRMLPMDQRARFFHDWRKHVERKKRVAGASAADVAEDAADVAAAQAAATARMAAREVGDARALARDAADSAAGAAATAMHVDRAAAAHAKRPRDDEQVASELRAAKRAASVEAVHANRTANEAAVQAVDASRLAGAASSTAAAAQRVEDATDVAAMRT